MTRPGAITIAFVALAVPAGWRTTSVLRDQNQNQNQNSTEVMT